MRLPVTFSRPICSLLALLIFVDHCFGSLFCQFSTQPIPPHWNWVMLGIMVGEYLHRSSFSVMVLVGGLQGWFLLTGLPWNLPAEPCILTGPPPTIYGTSSQTHLLMMSLKEECLIV